jgi:hypothetical protein
VSGFDENAYVPAAEFERSTMQSVLDEFLGARSATIGFNDNVQALLYLIAGHEIHHRTLLRDRDRPLVAAEHLAQFR